jgi:hypothetical protein
MRWTGGFRGEPDEYGHADVLDWAAERPVLAVTGVLVCWVMIVFAVATAYGALL